MGVAQAGTLDALTTFVWATHPALANPNGVVTRTVCVSFALELKALGDPEQAAAPRAKSAAAALTAEVLNTV
jgi:hypothetical protein